MTIQQLRSFLFIAEKGSFGKAEQSLYLSRQALKKQMDALEQELGFLLFYRSHQGIVLTPAGEEFYQGIKNFLENFDTLTESCQRLADEGQILRIENPRHPRLLLEQAFQVFSCKFPSVKQQVVLQDHESFINDILSGRADLAECIYNEKFLRPDIVCEKLFPLPYRCLVSPGHPFAHKKRISYQDLAGNRVAILYNNNLLIQKLKKDCPDLELTILDCNNLPQIYSFCLNNGIFISKAYYLETLSPFTAVPLETDLIYYGAILYKKRPTPLVQAFLQITRSLYQSP